MLIGFHSAVPLSLLPLHLLRRLLITRNLLSSTVL